MIPLPLDVSRCSGIDSDRECSLCARWLTVQTEKDQYLEPWQRLSWIAARKERPCVNFIDGVSK